MSSPRSAPIYAWGEKPGPSRIEEEEEDRRPPEEEEVEETVPVPVPATSLPEKKGAGRAMQEWLFADHLQMASFVVAVLDGPDRHPYPGTALTIRVETETTAFLPELESTNPPGNLFPQREADTDHLKMASFVVTVLDGPDRHHYPGTALTIRVEMASFVVAVLDGPDRHPYPGTALTILVEMASFVVAVLDGPDRHPYPGTALTIRVESTNPPGNLFPQREADTDHLKMASFVVTVLDGPDRHPYPGTALTIRVEMASFVVAVLDGPDRHPYPGTALTIRVEMASFVVAVLDGPDRHPYPGTALTIRVEVPSPWTASPSMLERERATPQLAQIRDGVGTQSGYKAAQVLAELLRKPPGVFSATVHDRWSVAWIAVVLWVSRLHSHQASHGATTRQHPQSSGPPPLGVAGQAAQVLAELLRKPPGVFSATVHDRWSVAWIAVVLWVSRLHSHQASHGATARQPLQSSGPPPPLVWLARSAVRTLERLLLRVCPEAIPHEMSWELLTDAETFLDGVSLLTRSAVRTLERLLLRVCPEAIPHEMSWELLTDAETFLDGVSLLTRSALRTLERLLLHACPEAMPHEMSWELLTNAETFLDGVSLLMR
ncbi:UNVERIFIED_CONTAM: hypothetical protein K2H54_005179 [Gekko kuhli]